MRVFIKNKQRFREWNLCLFLIDLCVMLCYTKLKQILLTAKLILPPFFTHD
jgi:hypothetical protein